MIVKSNAAAKQIADGTGAETAKTEIWLAFLDTVRTQYYQDVIDLAVMIPALLRVHTISSVLKI